MIIKKLLDIKIKDINQTKIITYGFVLFSIGFVGYILISVMGHYLIKYIF